MKTFQDILYKVRLVESSGDMKQEVAGIAFDSRKVRKGDIFVAIKGTQSDGHQYINKAIDQGAAAILAQYIPNNWSAKLPIATTEDTGLALGIMTSNFFEHPTKMMTVVAITGTNGKTTTATLLFRLFRSLGYNCGLISTVQNQINEQIIPSTHTTPDPLSLNELFIQMLKQDVSHVFMEASSHAIVQQRLAGIDINLAVFTNISHDHLDYHKTFENYIKAKKKLFDNLSSHAKSLVNLDDRRGTVMLQNTPGSKHTYALKTTADFKGKLLTNAIQGLEMDINGHQAWFRVTGAFNAYNLLAAFGAASLLGEDEAEVLKILTMLKGADGRFELVKNGADIVALVDYAHTPDALKNVLSTIEDLRTRNEKLITVVGCGGNRDQTKRPEMASIAAKYSDKVILTSDNPRNEDPEQIIEDMARGVGPANERKLLKIVSRKEAIKTAVSMARKGDIILVAGKGHETYQEIKGIKYDFDDRIVLKEMFDLIHKG